MSDVPWWRAIRKSLLPENQEIIVIIFSESNGTVLSTNWSEIGQKKTECQPPACMEYKEYEKWWLNSYFVIWTPPKMKLHVKCFVLKFN